MKNEKEKMLSSELYNAFDPILLAERSKAYDRLFEYNQLQPSKHPERLLILEQLLGSIGKNCLIEQRFHCDYGYNIHVGDNFYANIGCTILDGAEVRFGNNILIGPNVGIYTAGHPIDVEQRIAGLEYARPIAIGDNVWIGADCSILPGVTIGNNSIIGAGSVITKDVPPNVVAAGNPCKIIKKL